MNKIGLLTVLFLVAPFFAQAQSNSGFKGKVLETMDASSYSYVHIDTGKAKLWIAGPRTPMKVGDVINTPVGFEMKKFESPSLKRTFDSIFFVGEIHLGEGQIKQALPHGHPPAAELKKHGGVADAIDAHSKGKVAPVAVTDFKNLAPLKDGYTVESLLAKSKDLDTKNVRFRARVVKANKSIMGRNWYHFRDGTGEKGAADITVTSAEIAAVGDTVLVEGTVALNQDFGLGYKYDVLVEKAKLAVEK